MDKPFLLCGLFLKILFSFAGCVSLYQLPLSISVKDKRYITWDTGTFTQSQDIKQLLQQCLFMGYELWFNFRAKMAPLMFIRKIYNIKAYIYMNINSFNPKCSDKSPPRFLEFRRTALDILRKRVYRNIIVV